MLRCLTADLSFYLIAIPAVLVLGLSKSGFLAGFGSMVTPMLALTMPVPQAVALMLPLLAVMDITGVQKLWRECDRPMLKWLLPAGLAGMGIGMVVFHLLSTKTVAGILGVLTLLFLAQRLARKASTSRSTKPVASKSWGRVAAMASGFTSFVAHAGGPPLMAYFLPLKMPPIQVTATLAVFFAVMNFAKWIPYAALGLFDWKSLAASAMLLPLAPVGVWLGIWLTRRINPKWFYIIADLGMLVTGVKLVWDACQ